jgi:AraC-like DNA-binding protein
MENSILIRNITAEKLQQLIKERIHEEIQSYLKGLNQKTIPERLSLIEAVQYLGVSKSYLYKLTHTRLTRTPHQWNLILWASQLQKPEALNTFGWTEYPKPTLLENK